MDRSTVRTEVLMSHIDPRLGEGASLADSLQSSWGGLLAEETAARSATAGPVVSVRVEGEVAFVEINNPPVNSFSPAVRVGLEQAFAQAHNDERVRAIVLSGANNKFMAGADIGYLQKHVNNPAGSETEFRSFLAAGHALVNNIEAHAKPTVAAIDGVALGGGLELAMSCAARVSTPKANLGLPELRLGIIPGLGGTQRLPRLVGMQKAVEMMLLSKNVKGAAAKELGLVDEVCSRAELLATASRVALQIANGQRERVYALRLDDRVGGQRMAAAVCKFAKKQVEKKSPLLSHPHRCLDAILAGVKQGGMAGIDAEMDAFAACAKSEAARSLIHIFFAQRATKNIPGVTDQGLKPRRLKRVAVVGAGWMGSGITTSLLMNGYTVLLKDIKQAFVDSGVKRIKGFLNSRRKKGRMSDAQFDDCMSRLLPTTVYDDFHTVQLVVEAAIEKIHLKQRIFADLEKACNADCVLATNTSTINIAQCGELTQARDRIVGLHFFSPAHIMPLVEIVRSKFTSPQVIVDMLALTASLRKTPVVVGNCVGFAANRMFFPYGQAAFFLLDHGIDHERIDKAIKRFGMPMGPFRLNDLVGIDVTSFVRDSIVAAYGERSYNSAALDMCVKQKRWGEKTSKGHYQYLKPRTPSRDPVFDNEIVPAARRAAGNPAPLDISDEEIVEMIMFPVVNESCRVLDEGVVVRASDLDITSVMAYGFPPFRGGMLHWADTVGAQYIADKLAAWQRKFNSRFFEPSALLKRVAAAGGKLGGDAAAGSSAGCGGAGGNKSGDDVVIVAYGRTAVGRAGRGSFKDTPFEDLMLAVLRKLLADVAPAVKPGDVGDVVIGNVLGKGDVAATHLRVSTLLAGLPDTVPVRIVNRLCSSGLQSIADVAASIRAGYYDIGIAGGVESMSTTRMAHKISANPKTKGTSVKDAYLNMGQTSENVAARFSVSREEQDAMAVESHKRAAAAIKSGKFVKEIVPVTTRVKGKDGQWREVTVTQDEGVRLGTTMARLARLRPVFRKRGSTTAGNASQLSDGAAGVVLMKRSKADELGLKVLGVFRSFHVAGVPPAVMGIGPAYAIPPALAKAGVAASEVDLYEVNEAFASQASYCCCKLGLDMQKVNVNGGAIALGHPLGCTGSRMTATLLSEMERRDAKVGVVSMCIGTGMGAAAVITRD